MIEKVWLVNEDTYGAIGVATSILAGKQWLIDSLWVTEKNDVWNPQTQEITTLKDLYGENWEKIFLTCDEKELENMGFFFCEMELHKEK